MQLFYVSCSHKLEAGTQAHFSHTFALAAICQQCDKLTEEYTTPGGGVAVVLPVVGLSARAAVNAGALAAGVVTSMVLEAGRVVLPTLAVALAIYVVPGCSPGIGQLMVGQVVLTQPPVLLAGHRVTV